MNYHLNRIYGVNGYIYQFNLGFYNIIQLIVMTPDNKKFIYTSNTYEEMIEQLNQQQEYKGE